MVITITRRQLITLVVRRVVQVAAANQLLVVAMARTSIHRLVLDDNKVIFDEEIPIDFRVRDFILHQDGALILSLDEGSLIELVVKSDK